MGRHQIEAFINAKRAAVLGLTGEALERYLWDVAQEMVGRFRLSDIKKFGGIGFNLPDQLSSLRYAHGRALAWCLPFTDRLRTAAARRFRSERLVGRAIGCVQSRRTVHSDISGGMP